MTELYVLPDGCAGTWWVSEVGAAAPLSQHGNVNDAEAAAMTQAGDRGADRVIVFDRYHRTRCAVPAPAASSQPGNARSGIGGQALSRAGHSLSSAGASEAMDRRSVGASHLPEGAGGPGGPATVRAP